MELILPIVLLITGLVIVLYGANFLVDGASCIARKAGLSEFVIGMAIVGIGTSMPELVVCLTGAISGNSDVTVGNIVGSNIFNTLVILGVVAVISPLLITRTNRRRDLPICLAVTAVLILLGFKNTFFGIGTDGLSRIEGALFLAFFAWYLYASFKSGKEEGAEEESEEKSKNYSVPVSILMVILGIAGLIGGGQLFVNNATTIAHQIGVSDKIIAITILAGGTSLPEMVSCIVSALKGKGQLALGNIVGSNISNILLILGCSAVVRPISFAGMSVIDLVAVIVGAIIVSISAYTFSKDELDRTEGAILLLCEVAYMSYLVMTIF